jgi:signal transduction histidine kinase
VNLRQLTADYHRELRLRGADATLVLDTLSLPLRRTGASPAAALDRLPARAGYTVKTPPVALNPFRELYVRAAFQPPTSYILRAMGGLLGGSVLLLALTTCCFTLMLSTILRQKKLSDVKNDFINNMTHELKTPLATVSAAVEALQNFGALNDPAKTQAYLSISRTELQRLSDLVEKVLNIAADERQPLALRPEPVQPAELVNEIVARHQLQAAKPVTFDVQATPAGPVQVDKLHMGNVINNLIDNAIKYSGAAVTITIRSRQDATGWHLSVADDGPGIAPAHQAAVFDQFFRVPTGNLHNVKGFGLGLYYVRQVVERHGGRIAVQSEPGRGSRFAVWIPQG